MADGSPTSADKHPPSLLTNKAFLVVAALVLGAAVLATRLDDSAHIQLKQRQQDPVPHTHAADADPYVAAQHDIDVPVTEDGTGTVTQPHDGNGNDATPPYVTERYPSPQQLDRGVDEHGNPVFDYETNLTEPNSVKIVMWPGVRVGNVRKLNLEEGGQTRSFYMKTLSLDPPIFGA